MLHVKSCNVKHNSESVFRYFASEVNRNQSTKCSRKALYAICSYSSLKKVGMFLCTPQVLQINCLVCSDWALYHLT